MELTVHGKQIDVGDALRTHVTDKIEDLNSKYLNHATFATVTFAPEAHKQIKTNILFKVGKNITVMADAVEHDPYVSFESAAEKVGKQLRRYKRKLRDHHDRMEQTPEGAVMKARDYILAANEDEPESELAQAGVPEGDDPVVIAEMARDIETMSVSDAVMRMDLSGQSALMFRNAKTEGINVVYKRSDGNIGWIDPDNA